MDSRVAVIMASYPLPALFDPLTLRRVGEHKYRGPCPFHGGDNRNGFGVERYKGEWRWNCFTGDCGSGSAIDVVMRRDSCSFREALEILGGAQPQGGVASRLPVGASPTAVGELLAICDACGGEETVFQDRQYGNGLSRPYYTSSALNEAGYAGWEIAAGVNACVGPACLSRLAPAAGQAVRGTRDAA